MYFLNNGRIFRIQPNDTVMINMNLRRSKGSFPDRFLKVFPALFIFFTVIIGGCKSNVANPGSSTGGVWEKFNKSNSHILSNSIHAAFCDADGIVWFGTDSGAAGYNNRTFTLLKDSLQFTVYGNGSSGYDAKVTTIAQNLDKSLWFGIYGAGVVRFNRTSQQQVWTKYQQVFIQGSYFPFYPVTEICGEMGSLGEVWIATSIFGVARYTPDPYIAGTGQWHEYNLDNGALPNELLSTAVNLVDNHFWFGSRFDGAVSYDGNTTWLSYPLPSTQQYAILSMGFDVNGYAWFGKSDSGVSVLRIATGVWVRHFNKYTTGGIIPSGPINALVTDYNKHRWFGTRTGLVELNDSTWTVHNSSNSSLPNDPITALVYDKKGNLWIGTADSGVVAYNPDGVQF